MAEEKTRNPPRQARSIWFAFVAQADIAEQMEVVRWLRNDSRYRVVTIMHDRDTYEEDTEITRDGETVTKHAGETKGAHWHGIVRVGSKITASSLCKRFGGYLHFDLLNDPSEYAQYMLHKTFNACDKVQYEYSALEDDVTLWDELQDAQRADDVLAVVRKVTSYRDDTGALRVDRMLEDGDAVSLHALMTHSYFYKSFIDKSTNPKKE